MFVLFLYWINTAVTWIVGLVSLALVLRVVLTWAHVAANNSFMKLLIQITEPLLRPIRGWLGSATYTQIGQGYLEIAPLVALMMLLLVQWVFSQFLGTLVELSYLFGPSVSLGSRLATLLSVLTDLYLIVLMIRIVFSWMPNAFSRHAALQVVWNLTEPVLAPARRLIKPWNGLDFSPIIVVVVLQFVVMLVSGFLVALF